MSVTAAPVWSFRAPTTDGIRTFLDSQREASYSYREVGATEGHPPAGYAYDDNHVELGAGKQVFAQACAALRAWSMFPPAWTQITTEGATQTEPRVGLNVGMLARACGLWWLNACRVVYLVDEVQPVRRYGFAYGTLPAHVEQGEELFTVEHWPDDTVWYRIQAFSRPCYQPVRMAFPLARMLQRKFVRDSQLQMLHIVKTPA